MKAWDARREGMMAARANNVAHQLGRVIDEVAVGRDRERQLIAEAERNAERTKREKLHQTVKEWGEYRARMREKPSSPKRANPGEAE